MKLIKIIVFLASVLFTLSCLASMHLHGFTREGVNVKPDKHNDPSINAEDTEMQKQEESAQDNQRNNIESDAN